MILVCGSTYYRHQSVDTSVKLQKRKPRKKFRQMTKNIRT